MDEFKGSPNVPNGYEWINNASKGDRENRSQLLCATEAVISGKDVIQSEVECQPGYTLAPVMDETGKVSGWKQMKSEVKEYMLFVKLSKEAGVRFGDFTGNHIYNKLAIVLDNTIISAPVISARITQELAVYVSDESLVRDMEIILSAGCLPCRVAVKDDDN